MSLRRRTRLLRKAFSLGNLDYIFPLLLSILILPISALGLGLSESVINSLTLAVLASLSFSLLRDRIERKDELNRKLQVRNNGMAIRDNYQDIVKGLIKSSKQSIWMLLRSGSIIYELRDLIRHSLAQGHSIKVVVCKRGNDDLIEMMMLESNRTKEEIKSMFSCADNQIEVLSEHYPEQFKCKYIDFVPSKLMYLIDPEEQKSNLEPDVYIIPVPYMQNARQAPSLLLSQSDNRGLFLYYFDEIKRIWEHGR